MSGSEKAGCRAREAWMTGELEGELRGMAQGGVLSCDQIQQFAGRHGIDVTKMKPFVDMLGLKVTGCQKLCAP